MGSFVIQTLDLNIKQKVEVMKKYFIGIVALAFLAACSGKAKQEPVEVEEETIAVAEAAPDAPSLPELPTVKPKVKPINMRDSLKVEASKGAVIQKKYKGVIPAPKATAKAATTATGTQPATAAAVTPAQQLVDYEMVLFYQDTPDGGVYELDAVYQDDQANKQVYTSTGKQNVKKGTPTDEEMVIYEFVPDDGTPVFYFVAQGDSITLVDENFQEGPEDYNYSLVLEP